METETANPALVTRRFYRIKITKHAQIQKYDTESFKYMTVTNHVDHHRKAEYRGESHSFAFGSGKSAFFWIDESLVTEWEAL